MDLKVQQTAQTKIQRDTTFFIEEGPYTGIIQEVIDQVTQELKVKNLELISFKPIEIVVREYFDAPKPEPQEAEAIEVD